MTNTQFDHRFTVPLHEIDAAGVLFFAHMFRHAHDAYEAFMSSIGFSLNSILDANVYQLPLVHSEADFLRPIHHADEICIQLQVTRVGQTSFSLSFRFLDSEDSELALVRTVHVAKDPETTKSRPIPEDLRKRLKMVQPRKIS